MHFASANNNNIILYPRIARRAIQLTPVNNFWEILQVIHQAIYSTTGVKISGISLSSLSHHHAPTSITYGNYEAAPYVYISRAAHT
jgi:hypothetical protein